MPLEDEIKIEYAEFCRGLKHPFVAANTEMRERHGFYVRITKIIQGATYVGYGEAAPLRGHSVENLEDIRVFLKDTSFMEFLSKFAKASPLFPASLRMAMDSAFVEISLDSKEFDFEYRGEVKVNAVLSLDNLDASLQKARMLYQKGFETFKIKTSPAHAKDVVALVKKMFQDLPEIKVRLDGNQSFIKNEALAFVQEMNEFPIEYWEDPLNIENENDWLEVKALARFPLAVDQGFISLKTLYKFLEKKMGDVFVIKPTVIGGITQSLYAIRILEEAKKDYVITTALETEVGRRAVQVLSLQYPADKYAYGLATGDLFSDNNLLDFPVIKAIPKRSQEETAMLEKLKWAPLS